MDEALSRITLGLTEKRLERIRKVVVHRINNTPWALSTPSSDPEAFAHQGPPRSGKTFISVSMMEMCTESGIKYASFSGSNAGAPNSRVNLEASFGLAGGVGKTRQGN